MIEKTLKDEIAIEVMKQVLASKVALSINSDQVAQFSYKLASAMMRERRISGND